MSTISKFAGRVVCTKAQFDALAEKDPNKEYLVTDDDTYGGGKYYMHDVTIKNKSGAQLPIAKFKYISTDNTKFSPDKFNFLKCFDVYATNNSTPPTFYGVRDMTIGASSGSITYYTTYPFTVMSTAQLIFQIAEIETNDNVFEL